MRTEYLIGLTPAGFHRFAVHLWGDETETVPTICVHGLTRTGRDFDYLAPVLAVDREVACPDVVGRGQSNRLRDPTHYTNWQYAMDMTAVMASIGDREVDWVGTSMGGLIGMIVAAQPGNPIRRLVLNDVGPFISAEAIDEIGARLRQPVHPDQASIRTALRESLAEWGELPEGAFDHLAAFSEIERPDGSWERSYDPAIAEPFKNQDIGSVDLWPLWEAITCPVLVIRGAHSKVLSAETAARMAERDGVDLVEIAGCGHAPSLMTDDQITLVRDWLDA
ncbi:MAG: alpha/beta hydrolase [Pseudomonadota bacterium]